MKKIVFISLLASTLFAEQDHDISDFFIDQDVKKVTNASGYGKASTYSLLYAKHQLTTNDKDLHFFYGAKMGIVKEEYTRENGFGLPLNKLGTYYAAAVGLEYDLNQSGVLLAEGSRCEDHFQNRYESKVNLTYTYHF